MIRVFLADDHPVMRVRIRALLDEQGDITVIGEASDGRAAVSAPELSRADVLVLDLSLPILGGAEVLHRLRRLHPTLPVVIHTMYPEDQFAPRLLAAGTAGFVSKDRPPMELVAAVRRAAKGFAPLPRSSETPSSSPLQTLTRRELQVFRRVVEGAFVTDLAAELDVHSCTISNHLSNVKRKLGRTTIAELVHFARNEGVVDPNAP